MASEVQQNHFLVVDDDAQSRGIVVEYLNAMGYELVSEACDGADAFAKIQKDSSISFVISDWDMPTVNGLSLLQQIKTSTQFSHIPVLIMTSPISQEAEKVVLAAESLVDGYLIKPFRAHVFREKIDRVLSKSLQDFDKIAVVIDDDPDSRETVVEYLKKVGFAEVKSFANGKAAKEFLMTEPGNLGIIVSDWEMPEMNGIELLRLCKTTSHLKEVPFLMITSQSSLERTKVMQAAKADVDEYLLKPFNILAIKKRVESLMARTRSRGAVQLLLADGAEHADKGRYQAAQKKFEEALQLDGEYDVVHLALGDVIAKTKGVEAAIPHYKKAAESGPFNARNYHKLASAYEQVGWMDQAIMVMQAANEQINFDVELHFNLGRLYNKAGQVPQARTEFEKVLEIQADHQEARLLLAMITK